ncbi:MAG: hypothetical protein KGO82_08925 [Bacteroidota bacterium]|nr:hypothetical protein [Bacteroidota bacterium]
MKKILSLLLAVSSICIFSANAQNKAGRNDSVSHAKWYTCSMHDSVHLSKPGNCPVCGMRLQLSEKEKMNRRVVDNYSCPSHPGETSDKPGTCSHCGKGLVLTPKERMNKAATGNYTCSMHGEVKSGKPGVCPKCGMALTKH